MTWKVVDVMARDVATVGRWGEVMAPDVVTTTANAPLATAASLMFEHHLKVLPVVDSQRKLVGVVSRSRLLRVFLRNDESIRKEIARDYLHHMPLPGGSNIEVEVVDGVVHLSGDGEVGGHAVALLIHSLAEVPGVVGVENHIEVASTGGRRRKVGPAA
jgi:CBS-domain-containing membrane protein